MRGSMRGDCKASTDVRSLSVSVHDAHTLVAPLSRSIHTAITQPSISVGLGLVYRFDPIRVEVNVGVPLVAAKGEVLKRGPQVGIGLEFL
jgi:hypothetical protein